MILTKARKLNTGDVLLDEIQSKIELSGIRDNMTRKDYLDIAEELDNSNIQEIIIISHEEKTADGEYHAYVNHARYKCISEIKAMVNRDIGIRTITTTSSADDLAGCYNEAGALVVSFPESYYLSRLMDGLTNLCRRIMYDDKVKMYNLLRDIVSGVDHSGISYMEYAIPKLYDLTEIVMKSISTKDTIVLVNNIDVLGWIYEYICYRSIAIETGKIEAMYDIGEVYSNLKYDHINTAVAHLIVALQVWAVRYKENNLEFHLFVSLLRHENTVIRSTLFYYELPRNTKTCSMDIGSRSIARILNTYKDFPIPQLHTISTIDPVVLNISAVFADLIDADSFMSTINTSNILEVFMTESIDGTKHTTSLYTCDKYLVDGERQSESTKQEAKEI